MSGEPAITPEIRPEPPRGNMLDALIARARAALVWERVWPQLAAAGCVMLVFLALSWFGLFEHLPPDAMVLLDELCSGTNPSEGEEIFELVVSTLARLEPQVFITTHFLAFAARLERERKISGLGFLQVELGADRRATFQFIEGVAKTSLAGHAAERLGVTRDQLDSLVERNTQRFRAATPPAAGAWPGTGSGAR